MISVDTNVLVRILIDDSGQPEQVRLAREQVKQAGIVFVTQVVQVETVWVLETSYKIDKKNILFILEHLAYNSCFKLEQEEYYIKALHLFHTGKADFSDYLILAASQGEDCDVLTFDKRFGRSNGAKFLSAG